METRNLTCIGCPLGCALSVEIDEGKVVRVSGNTCLKGDAYARKEVTSPTRIVTTTLRVFGGKAGMVSCKTRQDIPKEKIFEVTKALAGVVVPAPVKIGDVLVADVAGCGVDIVATKDVEAI